MKRWYVVQVYAGYEEAIRKDIERRIKEQGFEDLFGEILVPSARVKHMFDAAAMDDKSQQLFPGYILIEMEASPQAMGFVLAEPRALKFLGGKNPTPVMRKEMERIKAQMSGEITVGAEEGKFVMGSEVEIQDGPFAGFVGIVENVDQEGEKLTVMVSIFGRMTPVDLGFHQVK